MCTARSRFLCGGPTGSESAQGEGQYRLAEIGFVPYSPAARSLTSPGLGGLGAEDRKTARPAFFLSHHVHTTPRTNRKLEEASLQRIHACGARSRPRTTVTRTMVRRQGANLNLPALNRVV
ncbi:unnamed protein product [Ixodes hexagonus]